MRPFVKQIEAVEENSDRAAQLAGGLEELIRKLAGYDRSVNCGGAGGGNGGAFGGGGGGSAGSGHVMVHESGSLELLEHHLEELAENHDRIEAAVKRLRELFE